MAVLLGIAGKPAPDLNDKSPDDVSSLARMQQLIYRTHRNVSDEVFAQNGLCGTRVFNSVYESSDTPTNHNGVVVWLDGDLGDSDEPAKFVAERYRQNGNFSFLAQERGVYALVVCDLEKRQVHLVSCPNGMRHLHFATVGGKFVWSSEVKGFLGVTEFTPRIDELAVLEFINTGQLLGNRTWFEDVRLVPSGSVISCHLDDGRLRQQEFWNWTYSENATGSIDELTDELGERFQVAVKRAFEGPGRKGITLSGGLDSRAILAVANQQGPIDAVTFGEPDSVDMRYAKVAAQVNDNTTHHAHSLTTENWLAERLYGSWFTDGSLNLLHNHAFPVWRKTSELFDIHIQSFAGDAWMGGSFLTPDFVKDPRPASHTKYLSEKLGFRPVWEPQRFAAHFAEFASDYQHTEQFLTANRVRRFTVYGSYFIETYIQDRKPTLDRDLYDFCYSLPSALRYDSKIYNRMLIRTFPEYYQRIPWAKTGYPVSYPRSLVALGELGNRVQQKVKSLLGLPPSPAAMANYTVLARQKLARTVFTTLLSDDALLLQWLPQKLVTQTMEAYLEGKGDADNCCRLLTLELWLQQVFNSRFRSLEAEQEELARFG